MKPIDYRNEKWADVLGRVRGLRQAVYRALVEHGPCTTRELAQRSGIDLLTVRPRVTELYQLGLARCLDDEAGGHEGCYEAIPTTEACQDFYYRQRLALGEQLSLL